MNSAKPRVLLTNDDGPPGPDSPYIYGLYKFLVGTLGWDVKVVIPSSQKSWIGKAYHIREVIKGTYYYPRDPDGLGETSDFSRQLKEGEVAEWVLLDATPATCANVALHNLYPNEIDLVVSGPNLGRNSSSAFALSSGTIGAALSSSLSRIRSIAISYGTVKRPVLQAYHSPAHTLSCRIIQQLWQSWGTDSAGLREGEVDLYTVNIPMIEELLNEGDMKVVWTTIWRNTYGRLFKHIPNLQEAQTEVNPGGPDAQHDLHGSTSSSQKNLVFKFSPDFRDVINPPSLPAGTDAWALSNGWTSITPLRASYAEVPFDPVHLENSEVLVLNTNVEGEGSEIREFKFKL